MSLYRQIGERLLEGEFNYAFSVSLKHKYLYVENAKSACTTVKSILGEWEFSGVKLGTDIPRAFMQNVHANVVGTPFVKPFQLGEGLFNTIARSGEYFRFSFVRNPYVRLLSAYLDKVLGRTPESNQIFAEAEKLGINGAGNRLDFLSFLKAIESIADDGRQLDKHWRPQSFQLWPEEISYGFIGKVENFQSDIAYIAARLGFAAPTVSAGSHGHETKAASQILQYYGDEATALVLKLYARDFEDFAYDQRLPQ